MRRATDAKLNTIVHAAGLAPWRDIIFKAANSTWLDLVAVSPAVCPLDPAWPASTRVVGYWFLDEPNFVVDEGLRSFVGDDKPVVLGFGSMHGFDSEATTRMLFEAVRGLPKKVVVQAGWAGLGLGDVPPNVFLAKFVPHSWLFERASCVVHHGGAGTTAAALRAGVPQTIAWHLGDQPSWGRRVELLGVGPKTLSFKKLTSKWLRARLETMLSDATMQDEARVLGSRIRGEDGVAKAAELLEAKMAGPPPMDLGAYVDR